jgi:menaquinone-specific isochorismate synthase
LPEGVAHLEFIEVHVPCCDCSGAILSPHASHLSFTPTSIHQTKNVQHLYSKCTATLIDPSSEAKVISLLHPTPALAGAPKEKALAAIETLEPFERGLYGGAIGWTTRDASDWVVSIRSCRIKKNIVTLYSGVGIVKGSDPEAEWDELNQKIRLFINC